MNQFNGVGNLVADVELKGQNSNVASFRVAIQRPFKNKQTDEYETDFLTCKAFGKTAEIIANNFSKGQKVGITGSIQTGSFDGKDGKKVFTTDVVVNQVTFVERKGQGSNQNTKQNNTNAFANGTNDLKDELPF
ncbi:MAG: single-stranded DNA-binding protein [Staphylococcus equorum]|uniref:single-stranded DNA-binding protein n=1 Tax=Staphylococcus TaxID=1279 RepID=UPI0025521365|nr:single-stranded DNA-binding protein [Staphylococcus equorum]MDK9870460.1 single-stranded DNA-binding protein [Staphylococcus equorum]MDK9878309.1 single-stranded DNA-binding protein [Staphylococcus equorum]MDN6570023.1 single-stranded DNA-binding protein [Staphylococcus equorum]MDN6611599.1 single-stranded DNA-binding protein [Staphylococcus equorum]MDN6721084.1 single-stranded DNA-binding protein [Staphylococcus equorum]